MLVISTPVKTMSIRSRRRSAAFSDGAPINLMTSPHFCGTNHTQPRSSRVSPKRQNPAERALYTFFSLPSSFSLPLSLFSLTPLSSLSPEPLVHPTPLPTSCSRPELSGSKWNITQIQHPLFPHRFLSALTSP